MGLNMQSRSANAGPGQPPKGAGGKQNAAREAAEAQRLLAAVIQSVAQAQESSNGHEEVDDDATAYLEALEQMLGCCVKQQNEVGCLTLLNFLLDIHTTVVG